MTHQTHAMGGQVSHSRYIFCQSSDFRDAVDMTSEKTVVFVVKERYSNNLDSDHGIRGIVRNDLSNDDKVNFHGITF